MSLPKLLSICCLLGIVFTFPTPPPKGFKREADLLKINMEEKCNASKNLPCSSEKVRSIKFKVNCSHGHYQKTFCQVKSVLKGLSQTPCNSTFSEIQIPQELLGNSDNCSSSHHGYISLGDFCSRVVPYIQYLSNQCTY